MEGELDAHMVLMSWMTDMVLFPVFYLALRIFVPVGVHLYDLKGLNIYSFDKNILGFTIV